MNPEELLQIIQSRGYQAKVQNDEVVLKNCIFCGNPNWNLELNSDKGVYGCWACKSSGKLENLLSSRFDHEARIPVHLDNDSDLGYSEGKFITFGSSFKPVDQVDSAKRWLEKRGIKQFDVNRYNITICIPEDEDHPHKNRIVFPLQDYWTGDFCGYISRDYIGNAKSKYLTEISRKRPFGYRVSDKNKPHVVVEGIIDGIRVHQAGFNAYVLLGTGSDDRFIEWCSTLPKEKEVIILLDGDKEGRKRANALKHLAATVRDEPQVITLPEDIDPADLNKHVLRTLIQEINNDE